MRVWLCLLGVAVSCHCFLFDEDDKDDVIIHKELDLRTAYRKYLPEEFQDVPEPVEENRSVNLTAVEIEKNKTGFDADWSARRGHASFEDSDMSESGKRYLRRLNAPRKGSFSYEYNSSEYREFQETLERRFAEEDNRTDVFEDDIDDLWDLYCANKTAPPNFNLAFSPRFMNRAYRRYSLSVLNITLPTTKHWIHAPLTGEQGILYDKAMERIRLFEINKNNTERIAAINKFIEDDMKGKNISRMKDIVRHFIHFKRKIGVPLNFTIPPISVSKELENMNVPDTGEVLNKFNNLYEDVESCGPPDLEKVLKEGSREEENNEKEGTTRPRVEASSVKHQSTVHESSPVKLFFGFKLNPAAAATDPKKETIPLYDETKPNLDAKDKTASPVETTKPQLKEEHPSSNEKAQPSLHESISTHHPKLTSVQPANTRKLYDHPAAKFLHKHKNKFLIGGIACIVAAKILT